MNYVVYDPRAKAWLSNAEYPACWTSHLKMAKQFTVKELEFMSISWPFLKTCVWEVVK